MADGAVLEDTSGLYHIDYVRENIFRARAFTPSAR